MNKLSIFGVNGIPEVKEGDNIPNLTYTGLKDQGCKLEEQDIIVIASKIISKAEGRLLKRSSVTPSDFAVQLAESTKRDPIDVEVVLQETRRPVKISDRALIMETSNGYVCANAGVDQSNIKKGYYLLHPINPDMSAKRIRIELEKRYNVKLAVIITDTFGRPWREGQTNIAIGLSGMSGIKYYQNERDRFGNELKATAIAIADQIAGASELITGKIDGIPVTILRGYTFQNETGSAKELIRSRKNDLFR